MMDLAKLKYASQLQEGAGLLTCVLQVFVPAVDGYFSYHATNSSRRAGQRNQEGRKI